MPGRRPLPRTSPPPRDRTLDRHLVSRVSRAEPWPDDHAARLLWQFAAPLDCSVFDADVKAVEGHPGKPPFPPRLLFTRWLFALLDGVTSAGDLARRCTRALPYPWRCGGPFPDDHTLSDGHARHHQRLRRLFVDQVAALRSQGLIERNRLAVDGAKKPGNAGNASHHREETLPRHRDEAEEQVRPWEQGRPAAEALTARQAAARRRATRERRERRRRAVDKVRERQQRRAQCQRSTAQPEQARANEAEPEATRRKPGDGGFRIGYQVPTVTDATFGLLVTTAVIAPGNDSGPLAAQRGRVKQEQAQQPKEIR